MRDLEASRLIDAGQLRLLYRGFGNTSSDSGTTISAFGVFFPDPNPITTVQADVQVVDFQALDCAANTSTTEARMDFRGAFFNSVASTPGDSTNDLRAKIVITRHAGDPTNSLRVVGEMFQCISATCSTFGSFVQKSLGTISCPGRICPTQTLFMQWEPANNLFRFRRTDIAGPAEDTIPYAFADASLPSFAFKTIDILHAVENCTSARKRASRDTPRA